MAPLLAHASTISSVGAVNLCLTSIVQGFVAVDHRSWSHVWMRPSCLQVILLLDEGSKPVPLADAATALGPTALAFARRKPDMQSHPRWGRVAVQCDAGYPAGARRAVVIIRGRSYPSLFGGMFASPELTLRPPGPGLFTDESS